MLSKMSISLGAFVMLLGACAVGQASIGPGSSGVAHAQTAAAAPGATVQAGLYKLDANHTQVLWSVDHMGFSRLYGMLGGMSGSLELDPAKLGEASLQVDIPLSGLTVTSSGFANHLQTADLFDVAQFPTARFVSRSVTVRGQEAAIEGELTLRGVTRPLTLQARFYGAGANPMSQAYTVGFSARGQLKRSDFGLGYAVPAVSDMVELKITAAFEKVGR